MPLEIPNAWYPVVMTLLALGLGFAVTLAFAVLKTGKRPYEALKELYEAEGKTP